jgi:hypothetical protein
MSELSPKESRQSKLAKIGEVLSTGGISLIYPEVQIKPSTRPTTKLGKFLEALATGGVSLVYPESEQTSNHPDILHDINRLTP